MMAVSDSWSTFSDSDSDAGHPYFIGLCHQLFTIPGSAMHNSQRLWGFGGFRVIFDTDSVSKDPSTGSVWFPGLIV